MQIELPVRLNVTMNDDDLASALFKRAAELSGNPDDGGCDWYTDDEGNTYVNGDRRWRVSRDQLVADMIDLAHTLQRSGPRTYKMDPLGE